MSWKDDSDFLAALDALSQTSSGRRRPQPTRYDARALLLPLGNAVCSEDPGIAEAIERVRSVVDTDRAGWLSAIEDELSLAVTEHVRSCDPQYLRLARYDFPYTIAARERLEARLRATEALGFDVPESLLGQIERADRTLAPFLGAAGIEGPDFRHKS